MIRAQQSSFYSGTSGLQLPFPKRDFAPEYASHSRLAFYSTIFNSIEINSSFYKLPQARTIQRWVEETTEGFRFTFKLWRELTHTKGLPFDPQQLKRFMDSIACTGNKKGSLLIQFPASVHRVHIAQVRHLLLLIREHDPDGQWAGAVEFRHPSWYDDVVYQLLDSLNMTMVFHDIKGAPSPLPDPWTDTIYLRFHGPEPGYRGSYDQALLSEYAGYIADWLAEGKTVYTYFNNTAGSALQNLQYLNSLLH